MRIKFYSALYRFTLLIAKCLGMVFFVDRV